MVELALRGKAGGQEPATEAGPEPRPRPLARRRWWGEAEGRKWGRGPRWRGVDWEEEQEGRRPSDHPSRGVPEASTLFAKAPGAQRKVRSSEEGEEGWLPGRLLLPPGL